jgi:hypothetical protein
MHESGVSNLPNFPSEATRGRLRPLLGSRGIDPSARREETP